MSDGIEAMFDSAWSSLVQLQPLGFAALIVTEASLLTTVLATVACGLLTLFLTTVFWRWHFENCRDPSSSLPLPPGSFGWPVIGETLHYVLGGSTEYTNKLKKYGKIYKTHLLGTPTVRVESDELVALLSSKEPTSLSSGSALPKSVRAMFGERSVIVVSGEEHAAVKKNLSKAFVPVRLKDYLPIVQACVRRHVTSWTQGTGENKMLGFRGCQHLVCDLILETVVGCTRDQDPDGAVREAFVTCNDNLFCIPLDIPGMAFHKAKKARRIVADFARRRLAAADSSSSGSVSILDVLISHMGQDNEHENRAPNDLQQSEASTEKFATELVDNCVSLFIAGADTVSSALCSVLKLLAKNPEKLAALRKELESQDLLSSGQENDLSFELLQSLSYVRAVNKEVLRVLPPVGGLFRLTKTTVELKDCQIPADWRVVYSVRGIHQENKAFTNKDEFCPERWLEPGFEEKLKAQFPCSYAPFGLGTRACLGKELALLQMSVFVVEVARMADWNLLNPDARRVFLPIEKPFDDMPVTFRKRK
ncbi:hypothetical protein EGW08_004025 [Elysia chlorotica]|uniref:Cytochrome P450 n=1 Tax=Elysia chlorotica TaxID=188477 RepID=A0A433U310_ELYCH|nr:hypothetical protein EGW08_004025 [Elysia chlorotica]